MAKIRWDKLDARKKSHVTAVSKLDAKQLATVAGEANPNSLSNVAHAIALTDVGAALRVYDAMLALPLDAVGLQAPCNALYWMVIANQRSLDERRTRRYLTTWAPVANTLTLIHLNAATLYIQLGDHAAAIAQLRTAIVQGDSRIARQLADTSAPDDLAPLRGLAEFAALAQLEPVVPPGLRGLHLAITLGFDADLAKAALACGLESIYDRLQDSIADMYELDEAARALFLGFGTLPDEGNVAFWRRLPEQRLVEQAIVIFDRDNNVTVYARDFDGFLCRIGHGVGLDSGPPKREKRHPNEHLLDTFAEWSPEVAKRDAATERAAANQLAAELASVLAPLRPKPRPKPKRRSR